MFETTKSGVNAALAGFFLRQTTQGRGSCLLVSVGRGPGPSHHPAEGIEDCRSQHLGRMGKQQWKKKDKNKMEVDGETAPEKGEVSKASSLMDTSEVAVDAFGQTATVGGVQSGKIKKIKGKKMPQVRKKVALRKEKAAEKALNIMDRMEAKAERFKAKTERVNTLKTLY